MIRESIKEQRYASSFGTETIFKEDKERREAIVAMRPRWHGSLFQDAMLYIVTIC
jgi:hypothetical protein